MSVTVNKNKYQDTEDEYKISNLKNTELKNENNINKKFN